VIPSLLGTGIPPRILAAATLASATAFVHRPHGGLVLLLAVVQFLVGGGFTTFRFGLLAGIAGTQAGAPLTGRTRVGPRLSGLLARLWPWLLVASLAWAAASWVIAAIVGSLMLRLTPAVTAATPFILVLILLSALGHDVQQARAASNQAARY